jgi:hypothetical protein
MAARVSCSFAPLFVLLALTSACVPEFDTDLSKLEQPQLLAISSDPAEAAAQKPLTLNALVAVPEGQAAPRVNWTMCLARKPLTELGPVNPLCFGAANDEPGAQVVDLGRGTSVGATLDKDICKLFGPLRPAPMGNEGAGRPADPDITGGFYQPFVAHLGDATTLGSVRIDCDLANVNLEQSRNYRKQYRRNENPRISELTRLTDRAAEPFEADTAPLQIRSGERLTLRAGWDECSTESRCGDGLCTANEDSTNCSEDCAGELRGCTGAEPYVWYNGQRQRIEPRREGITVAWYASRGHFEGEQTGLDESETPDRSFTENTYIADAQPGPATLWLVIRDTRGGQSWEIRHLEVTP